MKEVIKENNKTLDRLSSKIKDLLSLTPEWDLEQGKIISKMSVSYQHLSTRKYEYHGFIKEECRKRIFSKEELFRTSSLNIELQKFKGCESLIEIYTLKAEFLRVYIRLTARRLLPDVLKNIFQEDPSLKLVKSVECINKIGKRLITTN